VLLRTAAKHSPTVFTVLTAFSPPNSLLPTELLSVGTLQVPCRASVVTLLTTLLLLRFCSKNTTCAPRDNLWCFAGKLDTAARLATVPPMHGPLFSDRAPAMTFALAFVALFYHLDKRMGQCSWQKTAYRETTCERVENLLQSPPAAGSQPHAPSDPLRTPDTRTLVTKGAGACLFTLRSPSDRGTHLDGLTSLHRSSLYLSPTYSPIILVGPKIFRSS
jgi:hypothetical protein